jgi:hypothetical protein
VDEVLPDAPWTVDDQFVFQKMFDYLALDEGMSVDPACDKFRLRGYDALKKIGKHHHCHIGHCLSETIGKVFPIRRTSGVYIPIVALTATDASSPATISARDSEYVDRQVDRYGIGFE